VSDTENTEEKDVGTPPEETPQPSSDVNDATAKAPEDKATEEKAPEDKASEDKASEDKVPEVKAPEDKAPEDKVPEDKAPEMATDQPADQTKVKVQSTQFSPMNPNGGGIQAQGNIGMLVDLQLPVAVELGRVNMMVKDILELGPGAVVELNKFSGEPVDIYVNNKKFAEGEVVVVDQNFGVRILALIGPNERLMNLQ